MSRRNGGVYKTELITAVSKNSRALDYFTVATGI